MQSNKFNLNTADWKKWVRNTLLFSSPAILAFLVSLQAGGSFSLALGMASQALIAAGIDLTKKFIGGEKGGI